MDLVDAWLTDVDLTDARLDGCDLRGARLEGVTLDGASARGIDATGATLVNPSFVRTTLAGAKLVDVTVIVEDITPTELRYPTRPFDALTLEEKIDVLQRARDAQHEPGYARFDGADLSDASLTGVRLRDVSFAGASLRGATLRDLTVRGGVVGRGGSRGRTDRGLSVRGCRDVQDDVDRGSRRPGHIEPVSARRREPRRHAFRCESARTPRPPRGCSPPAYSTDAPSKTAIFGTWISPT